MFSSGGDAGEGSLQGQNVTHVHVCKYILLDTCRSTEVYVQPVHYPTSIIMPKFIRAESAGLSQRIALEFVATDQLGCYSRPL